MLSTMILGTLFLLFSLIITKTLKGILFPNPRHAHLPPGSLGWPFIGETLEFLRTGLASDPDRFVRDRVEKHGSQVFKTSLLGEPVIFFCGSAENKFLFSTENKMVIDSWWPSATKRLLQSCLTTSVGDEAKMMKRILMTFLNPEALRKYIGRMDSFTLYHISTYWEGKEVVKVHEAVQLYAFELSCRLFASITEPGHISKLSAHFQIFLKGLVSMPINIPGTRFYRARKAANAIREELLLIVRQRKIDLDKKMASPTQDLVSHLLVTKDTSGRYLSEMEIVDNILLLLFAGHDTSRSVLTSVMKYLAELPQVYAKVLREHIDIANAKQRGESLKWEDIQKMQYSWNVVSEAMRLSPPVRGGFREAIADFTYAGYTIPKGWKLIWFTGYTHKDPSVFPKPEKFDASRFEGALPSPYSYVPFGGGARKCIGQEFARLEILVFLHNIVKRFKWDLLVPGESFVYDPILAPSQGLPIRIHPLHFQD